MFIDAWGLFTSLVFLVYLIRFLVVGREGKPFFYVSELLVSSIVGLVFAIGYVCMKNLVG